MTSRRYSRCNRLPGVTSTIKPQPTIPPYIASSLVPARSGLSDAEATARMASDFREALGAGRGLDRDDLERLGFTAAQIDRLHRSARVMANEQAALT